MNERKRVLLFAPLLAAATRSMPNGDAVSEYSGIWYRDQRFERALCAICLIEDDAGRM